MPTTYTPDPTATQAPAAQPDPVGLPLLSLPAASEGATAASIAQPFKVLADFIAWLKAPRAKSGSWAQPIVQYLNARLQNRFYIDHMGYPTGPYTGWDEDWCRPIFGGPWPTSGDLWVATPGTGSITTRAPANGPPLARLFNLLKITPPTAAATSTSMTRLGTCVVDDSMGVSLKWYAALSAGGTNHTTFVMGLVDASGGGAGVPGFGAWFSKTNSDTVWQCNVNGQPSQSAGIGPGSNIIHDFRIEIYGPSIADGGAGTTVFYIDGALVATFAGIPIASSSDPLETAFAGLTTTTGGAAVTLYVGPVKYRQNTGLGGF